MMATTELQPWNGASGVAASIANTGFSTITKTDPDATIVWSTAWQTRGKSSLLNTGTTTPGYSLAMITFDSPTDTIAVDQPMKPVTLAAGEVAFLSFHGTDDDRQVSFAVLADGAVRIRDDANTAIYTSAAGVIAAGVAVVASVFITRHPTAGTVRLVIYAENGTTVLADSGLLTGSNTGALTLTHVKLAITKGSSGSVIPATYYFGVPRYDTAASGLLPAWSERRPLRVMTTGGTWEPATLRELSAAGVWEPVG